MTIYSIAEEAGVSASTVSRVINNKPGVNAKTRELVRGLLEKYHYRPDVAARGLVKGNTKIVGILIADIRNPHYTEGAYIIERSISKSDYNTLIFNTGTETAAIKKSIDSLVSRKPTAVVMIGSTYQTSSVKKLIQENIPDIPVVLVNGYIDLPNVYGLVVDEQKGVEGCVDFLAAKGHRRVVFVNDANTVSNMKKEQGYIDGVIRHGGEWTPVVVTLAAVNSREESIRETKRLLETHPETNAIIYANDLIATGGITALRELGKRVPEDVSVIGINNSPYAEICYPRLTSLDNKQIGLSTTCAQIILNALNNEQVPHRYLIYSDLVERDST